jgi:hypothetical protein
MTFAPLVKTKPVRGLGRARAEGKSRHRVAFSALCGIICFAVAGLARSSEHKFDGVYVGKRWPTTGSDSRCLAEEDISVVIRGESLTFSSNEFRKFAMGFYPRADGSFNQSHVHVEGAYVTIRGLVTGDIIQADVINPPCEYHWSLKKKYRAE